MKVPTLNKGVRITILIACGMIGMTILYGDFNWHWSEAMSIGLTIAYVGLLRILYLLRIYELRPGVILSIQKTRSSRYADFSKAMACCLVAMLWPTFAGRFFSDTLIGAILLFAPSLMLAVAGGFFFLRAFVE